MKVLRLIRKLLQSCRQEMMVVQAKMVAVKLVRKNLMWLWEIVEVPCD